MKRRMFLRLLTLAGLGLGLGLHRAWMAGRARRGYPGPMKQLDPNKVRGPGRWAG